MENEDLPPSQFDPGSSDQDSPPNLGEESSEPKSEDEQRELEQFEPSDKVEQPKSFLDKLRAFVAPLYMKVILSTLAVLLLSWLGLSKCSSPVQTIKRHYIIGLDPSWYPLELRSKEKNMTAFVEMLLQEFARSENLKIDFQQLPTSRLFVEFERNHLEGVVSVLLPPLTANVEPYILSDPIFRLGLVLIVNVKRPIEDLKEMKGRTVGMVGNARTTLNIDLYPDVNFSGYNEATQAIVDLNNKKIDGVIMDSLLAKSFTQGFYAGRFYVSKTPLSREGITLIMHETENGKNFINLFNQKLTELRADGSYSRLLNVWQLPEE